MSSDLLTKISNIFSYKIYTLTNDPAATAYAATQAAATKQQAQAQAAAQTQAATQAQTDANNAALAKQANYGVSNFIGEVVLYTGMAFSIFLYILFAVYTGHLSANDAIGRTIPYRIFYFIYGIIFSPLVAIYYIIQRLRGKSVKSYAILPIQIADSSDGGRTTLLESLYKYTPDEESRLATESFKAALVAAASG